MVRTNGQRTIILSDGTVVKRIVRKIKYVDGKSFGIVRQKQQDIEVEAETKNQTLHFSYATWYQICPLCKERKRLEFGWKICAECVIEAMPEPNS